MHNESTRSTVPEQSIQRESSSTGITSALWAVSATTLRFCWETLTSVSDPLSVRTFWSKGFRMGAGNFGDVLGPQILRYYGLNPIWAPPQICRIISVGSIIQNVKPNFSGYVIGSGLIREHPYPMPRAKILAVRGKLTRDLISAPATTPLGDLGLLVPRVYQIPEYNPKYRLGIIPHYRDSTDNGISAILKRFPNELNCINVLNDPQTVVRQISDCEFILSSSLHGLIVADAIGVPSGWIMQSNNVVGHGFKFFDYASSVDRKMAAKKITGTESIKELISWTTPPSEHVSSRIQSLHEQAIRLPEYFSDNF